MSSIFCCSFHSRSGTRNNLQNRTKKFINFHLFIYVNIDKIIQIVIFKSQFLQIKLQGEKSSKRCDTMLITLNLLPWLILSFAHFTSKIFKQSLKCASHHLLHLESLPRMTRTFQKKYISWEISIVQNLLINTSYIQNQF